MSQRPQDDGSLLTQVHSTLADLDPENLGPDAEAYQAAAVMITFLLDTTTAMTTEDLSGLWAWAFGTDASLLQPAHRQLLDELARRLRERQSAMTQTADDTAQAPGTVLGLGPSDAGRWLIRSSGNTVHVLDLDNYTYERRPGAGSQSFEHDNREVRIARIEIWPQLHRRMLIWFDDPDDHLIEHYCMCSRISSITHDSTDGQNGCVPLPGH